MQQHTDESVGQRNDVPRQYLDIALIPGQSWLQDNIRYVYCPVVAFDLPTQSVTYSYTNSMHVYVFMQEKVYMYVYMLNKNT